MHKTNKLVTKNSPKRSNNDLNYTFHAKESQCIIKPDRPNMTLKKQLAHDKWNQTDDLSLSMSIQQKKDQYIRYLSDKISKLEDNMHYIYGQHARICDLFYKQLEKISQINRNMNKQNAQLMNQIKKLQESISSLWKTNKAKTYNIYHNHNSSLNTIGPTTQRIFDSLTLRNGNKRSILKTETSKQRKKPINSENPIKDVSLLKEINQIQKNDFYKPNKENNIREEFYSQYQNKPIIQKAKSHNKIFSPFRNQKKKVVIGKKNGFRF